MVSPRKIRARHFFGDNGARIGADPSMERRHLVANRVDLLMRIGWATTGLLCLLVTATKAHADGSWVLWGGAPGKETAGTRVSVHRALAECLEERRSWEEKQRAYLRAANESRPQDQLPSPVPADSYRCLPDTADPQDPKGK